MWAARLADSGGFNNCDGTTHRAPRYIEFSDGLTARKRKCLTIWQGVATVAYVSVDLQTGYDQRLGFDALRLYDAVIGSRLLVEVARPNREIKLRVKEGWKGWRNEKFPNSCPESAS